MIDDMVTSLMSQDVLDETQITHKFLMGSAESWRWEFSCSKVLRIIEYIGCEVELDEDVSYSFLLGLTRFLMKVGVISEPSRKTHLDQYTGLAEM
uniref:F-box protein n=1 Tax=Heterorhabditis bacteriophora TaxID=37862 RepID=A0A1I7XRI5_HETBA